MIPVLGTSLFYPSSRLQTFGFTSAEMTVFADLLLDASTTGKDLHVRLGERSVRFTYNLEVGRAEITDDELLTITSNRYDLAELAKDLRQLAIEPPEEQYKHFHLADGVFMDASETVNDIVLEFCSVA